jgi:hypothetical protein
MNAPSTTGRLGSENGAWYRRRWVRLADDLERQSRGRAAQHRLTGADLETSGRGGAQRHLDHLGSYQEAEELIGVTRDEP